MVRGHSLPEGRWDAARVLKALSRRDEAAGRIASTLQLDIGGAEALAALPEMLERLALGDAAGDAVGFSGRSNDDIHSEATPRGVASVVGFSSAAVAVS